jgi:hypothetical protein
VGLIGGDPTLIHLSWKLLQELTSGHPEGQARHSADAAPTAFSAHKAVPTANRYEQMTASLDFHGTELT